MTDVAHTDPRPPNGQEPHTIPDDLLEPVRYEELPFPEPLPQPINWDLLRPDDLEHEWLQLNTWVDWLRHTYGLPATIIPPYWHRHPELVWELSALHTHWQGAYQSDQHASAPLGWHRDFADTRERLRDWTATSGTRLNHDQPTRQTLWPGEPPAAVAGTPMLPDRDEDFTQHVINDVHARQELEGVRSQNHTISDEEAD